MALFSTPLQTAEVQVSREDHAKLTTKATLDFSFAEYDLTGTRSDPSESIREELDKLREQLHAPAINWNPKRTRY